jgi:hypothetical protein
MIVRGRAARLGPGAEDYFSDGAAAVARLRHPRGIDEFHLRRCERCAFRGRLGAPFAASMNPPRAQARLIVSQEVTPSAAARAVLFWVPTNHLPGSRRTRDAGPKTSSPLTEPAARTPGPPLSGSMNSTPACSSARRGSSGAESKTTSRLGGPRPHTRPPFLSFVSFNEATDTRAAGWKTTSPLVVPAASLPRRHSRHR